MKTPESTRSPRILIVKLSSLGDLFHALPAVHCLKVRLGAQIDWVTQQAYVDLVRCFSDVDRVIPFHRTRYLATLAPFLRDLRRTSYDYVIDHQGLLKSAVVARLARAAWRIGPSFEREGARFFYSSVAGPRNKDRHAVDENMDVVRHLALEPMASEFPVRFPQQVVQAPRPRVALFPASRWRSKNWPGRSFTEVARQLRVERAVSVFLMGGPDDRAVSDAIAAPLGAGVTDMTGALSLPETGGLLQEMDLVISNDTGPMHMAAAVGVPVLAVFGPTDPKRTGPYGDRHRVLTAGLACRPCFKAECSLAATPCMSDVSPSDVVRAALAMLDAGATRAAPATQVCGYLGV